MKHKRQTVTKDDTEIKDAKADDTGEDMSEVTEIKDTKAYDSGTDISK